MKASKVLLLAAGAAFLSGTALAATAPGVWSSLWRTPDQQGQALLDAGQPARAAELFHDPRRRAYADLQAGGYAGAAQLLAPFTDAQSEYNRGNALAKSGQLQAALAAYDSALRQTPADRDIRHNRDLVQRALRHQQQQQRQRQQSPQSSSGNGRQGSQAGASQGQQAQSSNTDKQGSSGSQQSGSASQQPRAGGSQSAGNQAASAGSRTGANQPGNSGQAQREAAEAAALARAQRDSLVAGGTQTPIQKPETERQMALDQWLRQIPDSPAGLLRRKFLIEHIIRQQDGGNSPENGQ